MSRRTSFALATLVMSSAALALSACGGGSSSTGVGSDAELSIRITWPDGVAPPAGSAVRSAARRSRSGSGARRAIPPAAERPPVPPAAGRGRLTIEIPVSDSGPFACCVEFNPDGAPLASTRQFVVPNLPVGLAEVTVTWFAAGTASIARDRNLAPFQTPCTTDPPEVGLRCGSPEPTPCAECIDPNATSCRGCSLPSFFVSPTTVPLRAGLESTVNFNLTAVPFFVPTAVGGVSTTVLAPTCDEVSASPLRIGFTLVDAGRPTPLPTPRGDEALPGPVVRIDRIDDDPSPHCCVLRAGPGSTPVPFEVRSITSCDDRSNGSELPLCDANGSLDVTGVTWCSDFIELSPGCVEVSIFAAADQAAPLLRYTTRIDESGSPRSSEILSRICPTPSPPPGSESGSFVDGEAVF
jgi:hypothetical protein